MSAESNKPRVYRRSHGQLQAGLHPIVLEYRSRKEKQTDREADVEAEKYSAGLEDIQRAEADLVRVVHRATQAVAQGFETYDRERRRSAQAKPDGAIEDFPHNSAMALSETLKVASEIPVDMADALTTMNYRRRLRQSLKNASKALRVFRI
jgi:tellurite resistance protein